MKMKKITFLLAGLLFCWGQVLAKYELIVVEPTAGVTPCNGSMIATADGNTGPYEFLWLDESGTAIPTTNIVSDDYSSTLSNYCGEVYSVVVSNKFGCETVLCETMELEVTVFLEGAYDATSNDMKTTLNTSRGLLPGQLNGTSTGQPYNQFPWNYNGKEGSNWTRHQLDLHYMDVVDWVLVSLRRNEDLNSVIETKAGLIKKDGSIFFPEKFCKLSNNTEVYIVVEHRNHLPVMSPQLIPVLNNQLTYNFTSSDSFSTLTDYGQKQVNNTWVMYVGDMDKSYFNTVDDISWEDKIPWTNLNGNFGIYVNEDVNMDGDVNGQDKGMLAENVGFRSNLNK